MDRLDELRLFLGVVDDGSLAAAGRRLGLPPPRVTRALAELERRLGVRLIERTTRRSRPTEPGRLLAEQARRVVADYEDAMAAAAGAAEAPRGRLRIAAPLVFGRLHVAPIIAAFLDAQPLVGVDLVLSDRNAELIEEQIDVAIRIGRLGEAALVARRVGSLRRVLVASPAYLARRGTPAEPAALTAHETIHFAAIGGTAPEWRFQGLDGAAVTVRIAPRLTVNAVEAAIDAAIAGRGVVAGLSYQPAAAIADGRLVRLLRAYEPPSIPVSLVLPSARLLAGRVRAFVDYAAPRLAVLPALQEG